jgi:hypothetical protein
MIRLESAWPEHPQPPSLFLIVKVEFNLAELKPKNALPHFCQRVNHNRNISYEIGLSTLNKLLYSSVHSGTA